MQSGVILLYLLQKAISVLRATPLELLDIIRLYWKQATDILDYATSTDLLDYDTRGLYDIGLFYW